MHIPAKRQRRKRKSMENNMEMREFARKISEAVAAQLGEGYRIETKEVRKNNGIVLQGLLILSREQTVVPTIYLEYFLELYRRGMAFEEVVEDLIAVYRKDSPGSEVNMDFFRKFDEVKDRICYRLIGRKGNDELLKEIPHVDYLDMAVCFHYAYQGEKLGEGTILIYNAHLKMWGVTVEQLMEHAENNTPRLCPWSCKSLESVAVEAGMLDSDEFDHEAQPDPIMEMTMTVLSNHKKVYGAACILYPNLLESIASRRQKGFYIIPSSVHEVILVADLGEAGPKGLREMIAEVNSTQVAREDVLSDNLYYYDFAEKKVKIIF